MNKIEKLEVLNAFHKMFKNMNEELKKNDKHIRFWNRNGNLHTLDRMLERNIDIGKIASEFKKKVIDGMNEFYDLVCSGETDIAIRTTVGHLVFRVFKTDTGYQCRMVTATRLEHGHKVVF